MKVPVLIMPQGKPVQLELFELLPGVQVHAKPMSITAPRWGLIEWEFAGNGLYRPVMKTHPAVVDLTKWNETVYGCSKHQVRALVEAGFVEGERIAPRRLKINLDSFQEFRTRMRAEPWFWQNPENLERYREAMSQITRREGRRRRAGSAGSAKATESDSGASLPLHAVSPPAAPENGSPRHRGRGKSAARPMATKKPASRNGHAPARNLKLA